MPTKKSNAAKVTIWTDTMKADFSGTISACAIEIFGYVMPGKNKTAAQMREVVLKQLQGTHERLCKIEAEHAAAAAKEPA